MNIAEDGKKSLPSAEIMARDRLVCRVLERQPAGWVKVFHRFSLGKHLSLEVCYTPDKYVLRQESANVWLSCYEDWSDSWESLAVQLMDDFRNEVVPCWARLTLQHGESFRIEVEDRQPHWTPQRGMASPTY